MRVLHLFSGARRKADIGECLDKCIAEQNMSLQFYTLVLVLEEVDISRGSKEFDLVTEGCQRRILSEILEFY